jgi:hypothetical protein
MPDYLGSTMSDMKGKVYLESGSSISKRRLRTIMNELSTWGNTDKRILICTPSVGEIFLDMADAEGCLVSNSQYVIPGELGILMAAPEIIKTGFGSLFIVIDRSMEGYNKTIYSGTNYIAGDDWGYIIDPSVWYKIYHERPADDPTPGIQTLKTREVKVTENGNEIKKYEIMEQSTLACKEPRANATIAFGTIV